jgi:hypothetical protein
MTASGCAQVGWYSVMLPAAAGEAIGRSHRKIHVTVVDADTREPLPNVDVVADYGSEWFHPDNKGFITDEKGQAKPWLVVNRGGQLRVHATGYEPQPLINLPDPWPTRVTLPVLHKPIPYHVIEVPAGFRGMVSVYVPKSERTQRRMMPGDADWPPGRRAWVTRLNGQVPATLASIPKTSPALDDESLLVRAQTSDGTLLPLVLRDQSAPLADPSLIELSTRVSDSASLSDSTVAVWQIAVGSGPLLQSNLIHAHFYVGTRLEVIEARRGMKSATPAVPPTQATTSRATGLRSLPIR